MNIEQCLELLGRSEDHLLKPPAGMPTLPAGLQLPDDVRTFYERAGGGTIFSRRDFSIDIATPAEFVRANPVIRMCEGEYDISYDWFIIALSDGQYITIDLNPERIGRCYNSRWDIHALRGDSTIVARSFTEFLERSLSVADEIWFWNAEGFVSYGDAYDGIPE